MSSVIATRRKSWSKTPVKIFGGCPWVLLALVIIVSACNRHDAVVSAILIDRLPGAEVLAVDREELRNLAEAALKSNSGFLYRPKAKEGNALRLSIGSDRTGQVFLALEYDRGVDIEPVQVSSFVNSRADELKTALQAALSEDLQKIHDEIRKISKKEGALKDLRAYVSKGNTKESAVIEALEQVATSKDKEATTLVAGCLKGNNIRVSLKAVETLGMLKDPSTVDAITQFAERKVPEIRRHAIEAVRKIGGRSAAAWLFTLSTGHPDEKVRSASVNALKEVEAALKG